MYEGEIVHFKGSFHDYLGELETFKKGHPNGANWYRIKNPCGFISQSDRNNVARFTAVRIWGHDKLYQKYVDIHCPPDSLIEIKVLDKEGGLYKMYEAELNRPSLDRIVTPSNADLDRVAFGKKGKAHH